MNTFSSYLAGLSGKKRSTPVPLPPRQSGMQAQQASAIPPISRVPLGPGVQGPLAPGQQRGQGPVFSPSGAIPQVTDQTAPTAPIIPPTPQIAQPAGAIPPPIGAPQAPPSAPPVPPALVDIPPTAPVTPPTPSVSPETQVAQAKAQQLYQQSMQLSPEYLSTQSDLDKLTESTRKAYLNASGQAIPLEFITGQLKATEQRALGLAEPLQRRLARLQASREASLESSKFALERADKQAETEREKHRFETLRQDKLISREQEIETDTFVDEAGNTILYNTQTGETIEDLGKEYQEPEAAKGFTLSSGQLRYDAEGNVIARGGTAGVSEEGYLEGGYPPDVQFTVAGKIDVEKLPNLGGKRITDKSARQANLPFGITDKQASWIEQHRPGNKQFQALAAISEINFQKGFGALAGLFELREDIAEIKELKSNLDLSWLSSKTRKGQRFMGWETETIDDFSLLEKKTGKELVAFIKSISGVAVSDPERKMLMEYMPTVSMQDNEFNIALNDYEDNLNKVILQKIIQYDFKDEAELREALLGPVGSEEELLTTERGEGGAGGGFTAPSGNVYNLPY